MSNIIEKTYRRGVPGYEEAQAMARRMWESVGPDDSIVDVQTVVSAVVLFMVNLLENHWEPQQREDIAQLLARSIILSLRAQPPEVAN